MADLGSLKGLAYGQVGHAVIYLFPSYYTATVSNALSQGGQITGTISEAGVGVVANVLVCLYWRESGHLIKRTWTDASGNFTFTKLDPSKSYTVVAQDPAGGTQYNDLIYALVTPS